MNRPSQTKRKAARHFCRRKGSLTLQIILMLPVLIITTIAIIQIGFVVTLRQAVHHAATVAAREAAKGADIQRVTSVVNSILAPHKLAVGDAVGVVLENPAAAGSPFREGASTCDAPATPTLTDQEIRVTLCVDLASYPVANTLHSFGVSGAGRVLRASSVARKE